MRETSDTDWAYAAGFVDGEGCIAVTRSFVPLRNRFYYSVHVVVANNQREVLDWMAANWSGWVVSVVARGRSSVTKDSWTWRGPTPANSKPFLAGIRPYLRVKLPQCENALLMVDLLRRSRRTLGPYPMPQAWIDEQEKHYWIQRELNHRGPAPFVAKAMHSPRKIHRMRLMGE
jgi:hypothetical protein